ncbi:competence protein CoiA family protein [Hyphomicrobium sp.]|uniref:competence protein CoiA n=1 Tax=Hyphomicrobium sp. TaxID=82 RepID=UPI0025B8C393|nr:competence protein CoiA family protein [Hyphomicrobium sp.]MCC7254184.1 hypothetical protein [Hyphomicrobium sp.]
MRTTMKFAHVSGCRREAETSLIGTCPVCGNAVIARCGTQRAWHWAHRSRRSCDPWWENESDWHRSWKNHFPADWQEIVHSGPYGQRHIADVKTAAGLVLEFQHSPLAPMERHARETFYRNMVWVVDGLRRIRDRGAFLEALQVRRGRTLPVCMSSDDSALLRDWSGCTTPVYFDFGTGSLEAPLPLWRLQPGDHDNKYHLIPVARDDFVRAHLAGEVLETRLDGLVEEALEARRSAVTSGGALPGFERYAARRLRQRRRY